MQVCAAPCRLKHRGKVKYFECQIKKVFFFPDPTHSADGQSQNSDSGKFSSMRVDLYQDCAIGHLRQ